MYRNWFLPIISLSLCSVAAYHVSHHAQPEPRLHAPATPPRSPYGSTLAAVGMVEPESEDIQIGTHVAGVVDQISVKAGQLVEKGEPLFRIDDRQLGADLAVRQAQLAMEQSELDRLEQAPRKEELPASAAKVREAEAKLALELDHYQRRQKMVEKDKRVLSEEEVISSRQNWLVACEQLSRAQADDALLKAGTWEPALAVARAKVALQTAQVKQIQVELDRLTVKAPVSGKVLRLNIRTGEFVGQTAGQSLLILGSVSRLHVRVDLDETDIPRFDGQAAAKATVRGDTSQQFPLEFVRVEPYVQPKKSLTGSSSERVDTRVLQVIYAVPRNLENVHVGQQVDVFIESGSAPGK